jgi:DNA-directed RNA polymerase
MKPDFMLNADNKFSFVAFCLTMKELNTNPNYLVKLPIWRDATVSGIQHLTAIIKDIDLGAQVNLVEQTIENKPADLYSTMIEPITQLIRQEGMKVDTPFPHFKYIATTRKIVKPLIMIKPYDAKIFGLRDALQNSLPSLVEGNTKF